MAQPRQGRVEARPTFVLIGPAPSGVHRNSARILFDWPGPDKGRLEARPLTGPTPSGPYRISTHILLDWPSPDRAVSKFDPLPTWPAQPRVGLIPIVLGCLALDLSQSVFNLNIRASLRLGRRV